VPRFRAKVSRNVGIDRETGASLGEGTKNTSKNISGITSGVPLQ
jgi:hypothetical protein